MSDRKVAIRIGTDGKGEVKADFAEVQAAGTGAMKAISDEADRTATASERAAQRQIDAWKRQAAAARSAMDAEANQNTFNAALSGQGNAGQFATVNFDRATGAARAAAAAFGLEEDAARKMGNAHQGASVQTMMLQSAIFRAGESVSSGMPILRVAAQQGMEVAEAFTMGGAAISGGWSIAITGAIALLGIFGPRLFDSASASDQLAAHQKTLADVLDETTGRIKEQNSALLLHQGLLAADDAKNAEHEVNRQKLVLLSRASAYTAPTNVGAPGAVSAPVEQDPRIAAALAAFGRNGDGGALARSMDAIGKADPKLKDKTDGLIGMAAAYVQATRSAQQLEAQERLLTGRGRPGDQRLARGDFQPDKPDLALADAEAKLAAATSKREKAEAQADITRIKGQKAVNDGTMSVQAYTAAMTKADAAVNAASQHAERHAQTLAREAAAMDISARSALAAADAYLGNGGGAAGQEAEARRTAVTDATKKGIDIEAQARRQLAVSVAEGALAGAKSVSALREETAARTAVDLQVQNGVLAVGRMGQALSDEQALRAITIKQSLAYRLGLTEDYRQITAVIDAYKQALSEAHDEEAHGQAIQSLDALRNRIRDAELDRSYAGNVSGDADRARARLAANREADQRGYNDNDRSAVVQGGLDAANAELAAKRAQSAADQLRSSREQIDISQAEAGLIGKSADEHDRIIDRLKLEQQLSTSLGDSYATMAPSLLAAADATEVAAQHVKRMQDAWGEVKGFGDQFVDDVLNPSNWTNFGDMAKKVLGDIEQEFIKLAAINPLKNMLFGESNPTLGSVFSLLSGGSSLASGVAASNASLTASLSASNQTWFTGMHFAAGSDYTPGGVAWVGENGPELVNLPRGSRVTNAADTRRMMSAANDSGPREVHYHLNGNLLTPEFWQQIQAGDDHAAMRGSAGGAKMSAQAAHRRARRKLGTRG